MREIRKRFDRDDLYDLFGSCEYMASFRAFLDDSATHSGSRVTVVAGAIGKRSSWLSITGQWNHVLDKFGVAEFHAADLQAFQGEFTKEKDWDETKRRKFMKPLVEIVAKERLPLIFAAVENPMYDRVAAEFPFLKISSFQFCCEMCIVAIRLLAEKKKRMIPVAITFEARHQSYSPYLYGFKTPAFSVERKKSLGVRQVNFLSDYCPPLQVADLIAYECYKESSRDKQGPRPIRYPLKHLIKDTKLSAGLLCDADHVREHLQLMDHYFGSRQ